jgi:hypothetical protein
MDDVRLRLMAERAEQLTAEAQRLDDAMTAFRGVDSAQEVAAEYTREFGGWLRLEED